MFKLLAAIRKLRTALEHPDPDPGSPEIIRIPLSEDVVDEISREFSRWLNETPDGLPSGLEMKLHSLCPVRNLLQYSRSTDEPNRIHRQYLNTVREIEAAIERLVTDPNQVQAPAVAPAAAAELLLLLQDAPDQEAGIAVVDLAEPLRDWSLVTDCEGELIEFVRRNHCHVGGGAHAKLVLEHGWAVADLARKGRKSVKALLDEALNENVPPEIRLRLRLTYRGHKAAARLKSLSMNPPGTSEPGKAAAPQPPGAGRRGRDAVRTKSKGGKPPLEKSDQVKFQIYQQIQQAHKPSENYVDTSNRLKGDKNFMEQVKDANLKLDTKLVRKAIAFFDQRKRDQARKKLETDPT